MLPLSGSAYVSLIAKLKRKQRTIFKKRSQTQDFIHKEICFVYMFSNLTTGEFISIGWHIYILRLSTNLSGCSCFKFSVCCYPIASRCFMFGPEVILVN